MNLSRRYTVKRSYMNRLTVARRTPGIIRIANHIHNQSIEWRPATSVTATTDRHHKLTARQHKLHLHSKGQCTTPRPHDATLTTRTTRKYANIHTTKVPTSSIRPTHAPAIRIIANPLRRTSSTVTKPTQISRRQTSPLLKFTNRITSRLRASHTAIQPVPIRKCARPNTLGSLTTASPLS